MCCRSCTRGQIEATDDDPTESLHTSSWTAPVIRPSICGFPLKIISVFPSPSSLTVSVIALLSRLISSASLKRRQNRAGNERVSWENWSVFLERGREDDVWYCSYSSYSVACFDCLCLSNVLPFLYRPSLSILGLWHPPSPLSLLFLSQCFFSSHLEHNIRSKPFVHLVSPPLSLSVCCIISNICPSLDYYLG